MSGAGTKKPLSHGDGVPSIFDAVRLDGKAGLSIGIFIGAKIPQHLVNFHGEPHHHFKVNIVLTSSSEIHDGHPKNAGRMMPSVCAIISSLALLLRVPLPSLLLVQGL